MLKKKIALAFALCLPVTAVVGIAAANFRATLSEAELRDNTYSITFDKNTIPSTLTTSYQDNIQGTIDTALGHTITYNLVKAKKSSDANDFVQLAPKGMIYTFASTAGRITGAFAVTATYTGASDVLRVRPSLTDQPKSMTCDPVKLISGQRTEIPACDYLSFVAGESGNIIQSITIEYSCAEEPTNIKKLNGTYTGVGQDVDSDTWSLILSGNDGGVAKFKSLDKGTGLDVELDGTAVLSNSQLIVSFTSPSAYNGLEYVFSPCDEYHKLEFVSKSGTGANNVPEIDLYREYAIESFEGYSTTGTGWDQTHDQYSTSGARNAYVCEYKTSSGVGPIGGAEWSLMGSTDYMVYNGTAGRNGSKTVAFKNGGNTMRFFHMKAYFGMPSLLGRGTKLSFWARGPYSDSGLNNVSSYGGVFSFQLYYTEQVNSSTIDQCTSREFYVQANSDWQEYTMDIDPDKNYYSFSITTFHDKVSTTRYLPIDDICIYTDSPYTRQPWNNPGGNFHGDATKNDGTNCPIVLALSNDGEGIVRVDSVEYNINSVSYNRSTNQISIVTSNSSYIGTITGTYNKGANVFTNVSFSGTKKNEWKSNVNGNITCTLPELHWSCNEDSTGLREYFVRRYKDANGTYSDCVRPNFDPNDDRIVNDTVHYRSLGNAMKIRPFASGGAGFALANDFATAQTVSSMDFWVYNPTNSTIHLRLWTYTGQNFTNANEFAEIDIPANKWSYYSIKFSSRAIYNFQILDLLHNGSGSSGVALTYDDIAIH